MKKSNFLFGLVLVVKLMMVTFGCKKEKEVEGATTSVETIKEIVIDVVKVLK